MKKTLAWALSPVMFFALGGLAQAQSWSKERVYRAGYEYGYRDGVRRGEYDTRSGGPRGVNPRDYRDETGYHNSMGHKGDYKKGYREGFMTGYNASGYGRNGRDRYGSRYPDRYPNYPDYPQTRRYPGTRYPEAGRYPYPGGGSYPSQGYPRNSYSAAYERGMDRGYREGLEKGREDYRKNRSPDPVRHKAYREADDGYKSSYGYRGDYEAGYRRGFEDGYRQSFRR